jgi:hypothetical protein
MFHPHINNTPTKMPDLIIIKSDHEPVANRHRKVTPDEAGSVSLLGTDGKVVSRHRTQVSSNAPRVGMTEGEGEKKKVIEIEILDPKAIKVNIVDNWQSYAPAKVVKTMRRLYPNVGTASSQLSNLKSLLTSLSSPPPAEYLDALKLSKAEYKKLRDDYRDKRDKEGFNLTVVNDSDRLVTQALEMITSSDFRVLWPAAVICSGLRPVELLTVDIKPSP